MLVLEDGLSRREEFVFVIMLISAIPLTVGLLVWLILGLVFKVTISEVMTVIFCVYGLVMMLVMLLGYFIVIPIREYRKHKQIK